MKFYVFVSSYTLTSQLLTIPILSYSTSDSETNFFKSFKNYLKGISFSKSNF